MEAAPLGALESANPQRSAVDVEVAAARVNAHGDEGAEEKGKDRQLND